MFILHITPNIYLTEHQTSQLLLPFLLTFSARPPKESPATVISLMGVALDDSSVIIEAIDASILDFLVRSSDIVVLSCACSRFFSWYFLCEPSLSLPWDQALRISSQWGLTDSSIHLWKGYLPIYSFAMIVICAFVGTSLGLAVILCADLGRLPEIRYVQRWHLAGNVL